MPDRSQRPQPDRSQLFGPLTGLWHSIDIVCSFTPFTARSFAAELDATVVIRLDSQTQRFVGFTPDAPDDGFPIEGGKGYIVNLPERKDVEFAGTVW